MHEGLITETAFLLTELRYSVTQVQAQLGGVQLPAQARQAMNDVLAELIRSELDYQRRYLAFVPFDDQATSEDLEGLARFRSIRTQTVRALESRAEPWPDDLVTIAREQVSNDRQQSTKLANIKRSVLDQSESQ